jgi:hypothetical protein
VSARSAGSFEVSWQRPDGTYDGRHGLTEAAAVRLLRRVERAHDDDVRCEVMRRLTNYWPGTVTGPYRLAFGPPHLEPFPAPSPMT